jgi:hypothetical protein
MDVIAMLTPEETVQTLKNCLGLLKPGGVLLIHTCAFEWLRSQHDSVVGARTRLTRKPLEKLVHQAAESSGIPIRIESLGYRVSLLLPLVAAVKVLKRITEPFASMPTSDQNVTPGLLNGPLSWIMALEARMLGWGVSFPAGSSLYCVIRRLDGKSQSI